MSKPHLSAAAVRAVEARLAEKISPADRTRLQQLIPLIDGQGGMRLGAVLQTLFPDKAKDAAQTAFRQFRARLTAGAEDARLVFALESDGRTRGQSGEQSCYFIGDDSSQAAALEFSEAETAPLRRRPTVDQGYMEMREGKPLVRCYLSFSDNDRDAKERLQEKLLSRLTNSSTFACELFDRSQLLAGDHRDQALIVALAKTDLVLVFLSQDWLAGLGVADAERQAVLGRGGVASLPYLPVALQRLPTDATWTNWHGIDPATVMRDTKKAAFAQSRDADAFADLLMQQIHARVSRDIYPLAEPAMPPLRSRKAEHHARCHLREQHEQLQRYTENAAFLGEMDALGKSPVAPTGGGKKDLERRLVVHDLMEWLAAESSAPYCALLGETGMGKTTACLALVQALLQGREQDASLRIPIYLDLRKLRSRLTPGRNQEAVLPRLLSLKEMLDTIIAGTVQSLDSPLTADDVIRLVREDGALVIFDGLDEVLVHLSAADGQAFTRELYRILPPALLPADKATKEPGHETAKGKRLGRLLMTCRTQFFRTLNDQAKHFLAEDRDGIVRQDYRALVLLPFDEAQIRHYLELALPGEDPDRILDLFRSVHNLSELAERPYTLSLLTDRIAEIESWKMAGRKVTGVTVYGAFTAAWLKRDDPKHTFAPAHKALLMEYLAAELWRRGRKTWSVDDLEQWLVDFLAEHPALTRHYGAAADGGLNDRHLIELFKEDLRTATFLAREGEAAFRFAHTSLQEYFLAGHLHRALVDNRPAAWALPKVSRETLDFLGQLVLESSEEGEAGVGQQIQATLRGLRDAPPTGAAELAFAYVLHALAQGYPTPSPAGFQLAGADLRDWEMVGAPDKPLQLGRADFTGARLDHAVFRQANVDGANFSRANLTKAEFLSCRSVGARFGEAILSGTIFRDCNLAKADYAGADCHRSQWLQCRLEEVSGLPESSPAGFVAPLIADSGLAKADLRLKSFIGHSSGINACAFSPDGERLLSASDDQTLRLWDARSGDCLLVLVGHQGAVMGCAFSPDGKRLLSAGGDRTLRLWDARSGDCLLTLDEHEHRVGSCAFSPDGERLLSASWDQTLRVWDVRSGDCLLVLAGHQGPVCDCAFSPDGERLLSASVDQTLRLWDASSGECLLTLAGHQGRVTSCAFSPDGHRLLSASSDKTLRLWDALNGERLLTLAAGEGAIKACAFSPRGEHLLSVSQGGVVGLWDAVSGDSLVNLASYKFWVDACAFSPDGGSLVCGAEDGTLRVVDIQSGDCLFTSWGHEGGLWASAFSSDGERMLSGCIEGALRLWDAKSGECLRTFVGHQDLITACSFSPDGRRLFSASFGEASRLWDAQSGECLLTFPVTLDWVDACTFSRDGEKLLTATDKSLRLWDAQNGNCLLILNGHEGWVRDCTFSPDGARLLSSGDDKTLRLWDAQSGECLLTMLGHEDRVWACAFSPKGERVLSASDDGNLRLWDARNGDCLLTIGGHQGEVISCAFSLDGELLLSGGNDGTLRLWSAQNGDCLLTVIAHEDRVASCGFSPDGRRLLSAGTDGALRQWDAHTGQPLVPLIQHFGDQSWAVLDLPNNRIVQVAGDAWRWLGWQGVDPASGRLERYPAESFGPLRTYVPPSSKAASGDGK